MGRIVAAAGVALLVVAWCVLEHWNEVVRDALFKVGVADGTEEHHAEPKYYQGPITLTVLQFLVAGFVFLALWATTSQNHQEEMANVQETLSTAPWHVLIASHVFSSFWLHSLMMPAQVMSLGAFATFRALEVPVATVIRSHALGSRTSWQSSRVVACACAANFVLFYSYVQMDGCLCIWSGRGLVLTGMPLYVVFFLLLALPTVNFACQEGLLTQWRVSPFLMLAVQNLVASVVFSPFLLLENVWQSLNMMFEYQEIGLLAAWLCIQATAVAWVSVMLVRELNSFWTVALQSTRVVYWWCLQLASFYASTNSLLSVSHPKASTWSFGMLAGISLMIAAVVTDRRRIVSCGKSDLGSVGAQHLEKESMQIAAGEKEV